MKINKFQQIYKFYFVFIIALFAIGLGFILATILLDGFAFHLILIVGIFLITVGVLHIPITIYIVYKMEPNAM